MTSEWHGFTYGEHLDGPNRRSLGFRLLTPRDPSAWSIEVDGLARRLHATPYPENWPSSDLFCSVILGTGQRLIALCRFGLRDHTASARPGGLEVFGVVGPASTTPHQAREILQWLRQRRSTDESPLDGIVDLAAPLASEPTGSLAHEPTPVLPVRLWSDGALVFAATTPSDPDRHLSLLDQTTGTNWQWLPLIGNDFPLREYTQRGPVVAWTPHLTGVAVKLEQPRSPIEASPRGLQRSMILAVVLLLCAFLAANGWLLWDLKQEIRRQPTIAAAPVTTAPAASPPADSDSERFAMALYRHMLKTGALRDVSPSLLQSNYERLAADDPAWRVNNSDARLGIGALVHVSRRSPAQIEDVVRQALEGKGFDPELVQLICRRLSQRLGNGKE